MRHVVKRLKGPPLRVTNQPLANGGWVATIEDISELKAFELELERQRDFLNQIIDNVPVAVVVKDAAERRFVHANRAAEGFWGFSRGQAIGKKLTELFPGANTEKIDKLDAEAIASGSGTTQEAHQSFLAPSGKDRIVTSTRHTVRDTCGKPLYLISVIEDVTERIRL